METPAFLKVQVPDGIADSELTQLEALVEALQAKNTQIEILEENLKKTKEEARQLGQEAIPNILNQHGFSELRLASGKKVIVKEEAQVSVPEDKRPTFFEFLKDRNEEDIIKLQMQFARMEPSKLAELFEFLNSYNYEYSSERGVHPMTLKKYFKDLLGVGEEKETVEKGVASGKYLKLSDVSDFANVFVFFNTKIK